MLGLQITGVLSCVHIYVLKETFCQGTHIAYHKLKHALIDKTHYWLNESSYYVNITFTKEILPLK